MHQSHSRKTITLIFAFLSLIGLLFNTAQAQDDLLSVDDAFQLHSPKIEGEKILLQWRIADGYYLYKKRVSISTNEADLGTPAFSPSKTKDDPAFGKSEVFYHTLKVQQPFTSDHSQIKLKVKYQGCAEAQGVCYPPQTREFTLTLPAKAGADNTGFNSLKELSSLIDSGASDDELLPADKAFQLSVDGQGNGALVLRFNVASGYHLYKDKISVTVTDGTGKLGAPVMPTAEKDDDPVFGEVEVYKTPFDIRVPVIQAKDDLTVQVAYQGCSDTLGVCYPPEKKSFSVPVSSIGTNNGSDASTGTSVSNSSSLPAEPLSETDQITQTLQTSSLWIIIGTFFVFGLLLSLTPCVFPMIPILSSIIAGQGSQITTRKAFGMSLVYVLAMSVTYTVAGVLAGLFGENLQVMFQNPWIIGSFALIFVALAFSMFGFYELQLPSGLQSKITQLSNKQEGGSTLGVAIMGFLSALIVGPCVAPPLAGALIYIGQTGDAFLGGAALFAMSLGMGVPLLLIGVSAGKLLPKAGAWMDNVKAIFGVLMLGVAIWMAERILPAQITLLLWSALLIGSAVYLGALEAIGDKSGWHKLFKSLGVLLLLIGAMMLAGTLGGSKDTLQPLAVFKGGSTATSATQAHSELPFQKIKTLDDLNAEVAKGKPVMVDFYADWCVSCKEMEKFTFSDPKVQAALANVTLLKADVTENNANDKALMKAFGIIGPPAILFFDNGQEQKAHRVVGFKNAETFLKTIKGAYQTP